MKQTPKQAWYKNPYMTIFVVGIPTLVVIVCIFFIIYSIKIQDSTVRDDWHMDGKTLYQDASRDQLAFDLGMTGVMRFDGDKVSFELNYPKDSLSTQKLRDGNALNYPKTLSVSISHATDKSKDKDFMLTHSHDHIYQGAVTLDDTPAKYYLQVSNGKHSWRLIRTQKLPASNVSFAPLNAFEQAHQGLPDQKDKRPSQHKQPHTDSSTK